MNRENIINATRQWVRSFVVELNLCPFAKRELNSQRLHFVVSEAATEDQLLADLHSQLEALNENPNIETCLLIHPQVLQDFYDYNQFLDHADGLLLAMNLEGIYQIASFHPDYQFANTEPSDSENFTNKSPYPMLHLLREDSIEKAIARYPDPDNIHHRNIDLLNTMGSERLQNLLSNCANPNTTKK